MSLSRRGNSLSRVNRFGSALVALAIAAVVVAYPPPSTGIAPLFGVGNPFLPMVVSMASLLVAIIGGVLLARSLTEGRTERTQRLLVRVVIPLVAVAVVGTYLVTVAGFGLQSSFILGAVLLAIGAGVVDEFVG